MHRAANWKVSVYGREHGVPHFHIEGRGFRCSVVIASLEMIVGSAPANAHREAIEWAREHQAELQAMWKELNR